VSSTYPGALGTGDRIFSNDTDLVGGKTAGFDNEICTVTFNGNDLCHDVAVLSGRGDIRSSTLVAASSPLASAWSRSQRRCRAAIYFIVEPDHEQLLELRTLMDADEPIERPRTADCTMNKKKRDELGGHSSITGR
jgi:hypothetical protein